MPVRNAIFLAIAAVILQVSSAGNFNSGRIIGGKSATEGQFPWMAALFLNDKFKCSASIIGPRTILTAAHCLYSKGVKKPASSFHAIANYRRSAKGVRIDFESATPHPKYAVSDNISNDIGILTTTTPIAFSDNIQPISIASSDTPTRKVRIATAMGWGRAEPKDPQSKPDELQYVKLSIVPNSLCSKEYPRHPIPESKICAGKLVGICYGDSGGPLVLLRTGKSPIQIGIASYIIGGCGSGIYTRVSSYNDFISENRIRPLQTEARGRCPCRTCTSKHE